MNPRLKAGAIVTGIFLAGLAVGLLLRGSLAERRARDLARMQRRGGFVERMEEILRPRDAAQREAIRPYLEATDARNRAIHEGAADALRGELDSLQRALAPLLDAEQRDRLARFARRPPPRDGGPPDGPPEGPPPRGGLLPDRPPPR